MSSGKQYGPEMRADGYIARLGASDGPTHWFGGDSWRVVDDDPICGGPSLLLSLDLDDPKLKALARAGLRRLPLCSYINGDVWRGRQMIRLDPARATVNVIDRDIGSAECLDEQDRFPNPLPGKQICLQPMTAADMPTTADAYWRICDEFVGGPKFIRVLGPPIWLQDPLVETCPCGAEMRYVAAVGYERFDQPGGFCGERPFFIGEAALYWFSCTRCLNMTLRMQEP